MKRITRYCITMIAITCVCFSSWNAQIAYAADKTEEPYLYMNGENKIYYFLDEEGNPYVLDNGKPEYIAIPLERFRVTDSAELSILQEFSDNLPALDSVNAILSAPSTYVDLSTGSGASNSPSHSVDADFETYTVISSPYYKFNTAHATLRVKTSNEVKNNIFSSKKITFTTYFYDIYLDEWYSYTYSNRNCTGINGFGITFSPSTMQYGMLSYSSEYLKSATVTVWTSPAS